MLAGLPPKRLSRSAQSLPMRRIAQGTRRRHRRSRVSLLRPRVEFLEDRLCPSTDLATGTQAIFNAWYQDGGSAGVFGQPLSSAPAQGIVGTAGELALTERFENGFIFWSPDTGALPVPYALPQAAQSLFSYSYLAVRQQMLSEYFYNGYIAHQIYVNSQEVTHITFGDQTIDMGFALVTFSQEARILEDHGMDPSGSEHVVTIILEAFDCLQGYAVQQLYPNGVAEGFFIRDFVSGGQPGQTIDPPQPPGPALPQPPSLHSPDQWRQGVPSGWRISSDFDATYYYSYAENGLVYTQAAESIDQVSYLMNGWWSVTKYDPDQAAVATAKEQTILTMGYLTNSDIYFRLRSVNGVPITNVKGGDQPVNVTIGNSVVPTGLILSQSGLAAPFICQAADTILGTNWYFTNSITDIGTLQPGQVADYLDNVIETDLQNAVETYVNWASFTPNLPSGLANFTDLVNSIVQPVQQQIDDLISKYAWTDLELPVVTLQGMIDYLWAYVGPLAEVGFTGTFSLGDLLPGFVMQALDQIQFSYPSGVTATWVPPYWKSLTDWSSGYYTFQVQTDTVNLGDILDDHSIPISAIWAEPGKGQSGAGFLGLSEAAFDNDQLITGDYRNLALGTNAPWAALLQASIQGLNISPDVKQAALSLEESAPVTGPATNGPDGWSSSNRWIRAGKSEGEPGTTFNGLDFLSLETLMLVNGITVPTSPIVFKKPNPGPFTIYEGQTLSVDLSASGGGPDVPLYSLGPLSPGDVNLFSGQYSWQPMAGQAGNYTVTVSAEEDNGTGTATESFQVTVLANNPYIGSFASSTTSVNAPDNTPITLTASGVTVPVALSDSPEVVFYQDTNHDGQLEPGTDQALQCGTCSSSYDTATQSWTFTWTGLLAGLSPGTITLFAQAQFFSYNSVFYSNVAQVTLQVGQAPVVPSLVATAGQPISAGGNVSYDADGSNVFYDAEGNLYVVSGPASASGPAYLNRYDRNGAPIGSQVTLSSIDGTVWDVAGLSTGHFIVLFYDSANSTLATQEYNPDGSPYGAMQSLNLNLGAGVPTDGDLRAYRIAMSAPGQYAVVTTEFDGGQPVNYYRYSNGTLVGSDVLGAGGGALPYVAMDADGASVVEWDDEATFGQVELQRFDAYASPLGQPLILSSAGAPLGVAVDEQGRFVAVWSGNVAPGGSGIYAQRFLADGTPVEREPIPRQ